LPSQLVQTAAERWKLVLRQLPGAEPLLKHPGAEASFDEAIRAARELFHAELAHPESASRRPAILRDHIQRLSDLKGLANKAFVAGYATQAQVLAVETELLKAQIQVQPPAAEKRAQEAPRRTIEVAGQLQPSQQVGVYAKIAGFVEKVHVDLGDRVKKGQVLVELSVPEIHVEPTRKQAGIKLVEVEEEQAHRALQAAEAALAAAEAQVAQAGHLLGEVSPDRLVTPGGVRAGDRVILTKGIAIEGTSLLARERRQVLAQALSQAQLDRCLELLREPGISVVREAGLALDAGGVHALHDPTEGGLAIGLWELAQAAGVGWLIDEASIPILPECELVCRHSDSTRWG
jgi:biotin carboxyl carrier protein